MAYAPVITMQPFRFHSIYQPRIWGGQHMRTMLGRELPNRETAYGEAWEISDRPEAMSTVRGMIPADRSATLPLKWI